MTGDLQNLIDVCPYDGGLVTFGGGKEGRITGQGVVSNGEVSFDHVNYVEQLQYNLLSVSQVCDKGYSTFFNKAECMILKPGVTIPEAWILMRAPRKNDTYALDMGTAKSTAAVSTCLLSKASERDSIMWHRR